MRILTKAGATSKSPHFTHLKSRVMAKIRRNSFLGKIIVYTLIPIIYIWGTICWSIMKLGRGIYWFGNMLTGFRLDPWKWTGEV